MPHDFVLMVFPQQVRFLDDYVGQWAWVLTHDIVRDAEQQTKQEFEIERILDSRQHGDAQEYLVKAIPLFGAVLPLACTSEAHTCGSGPATMKATIRGNRTRPSRCLPSQPIHHAHHVTACLPSPLSPAGLRRNGGVHTAAH